MNGNLAVCSCERVRLALAHKEPDHVPFDLGGTYVSLIQLPAYRNVRRYLNLLVGQPRVACGDGRPQGCKGDEALFAGTAQPLLEVCLRPTARRTDSVGHP